MLLLILNIFLCSNLEQAEQQKMGANFSSFWMRMKFSVVKENIELQAKLKQKD